MVTVAFRLRKLAIHFAYSSGTFATNNVRFADTEALALVITKLLAISVFCSHPDPNY
jgi:hypothetical protein